MFFLITDDALRIIDAGGFYINFQKVKNPNELLTYTVHVLPNNTTVVRVGWFIVHGIGIQCARLIILILGGKFHFG